MDQNFAHLKIERFYLWICEWMRIFLLAFAYNWEDECEISDLKFIKKKKKASLLYCYTTMRIVGWWHPTINAIKTITNCQAEELPIITRSAITKCISNSFTMLGNLGKLPRIIGSFYRDFPLPPPLLLLYPTNSRFSLPHFLFQYKSSWVEKGLSKRAP